MKYLLSLGLMVLLMFIIVGCSSGSSNLSNDKVLSQSTDGKLSLVGADAALPTGVTTASITLTTHTSAEVPAAPTGATFAAAVECGPSGTVFSSPVTLRFTLPAPPAAGDNLVLYMLVDDDSNPATPSVWQMIGGGVTVNGNVASVSITHFSTFGLFITTNAVLAGDKYFRFDIGVYNGGMPSHVMFNDVDGTLSLPHAALLPVTQSYNSITTAPYGIYRDSNGGTNGNYFPAATAGAVFVAEVMPMGTSDYTYYKIQIISRTLRPNVASTDYGVLTFKYARILPPTHLMIDGEWSFASGAHLSVFTGGNMFDLTPTAGAPVTVVNGTYSAANTLNGTYSNTATSAGGNVTATFTLVNGKLNATFTGTTGVLGTVTLTGGTKL